MFTHQTKIDEVTRQRNFQRTSTSWLAATPEFDVERILSSEKKDIRRVNRCPMLDVCFHLTFNDSRTYEDNIDTCNDEFLQGLKRNNNQVFTIIFHLPTSQSIGAMMTCSIRWMTNYIVDTDDSRKYTPLSVNWNRERKEGAIVSTSECTEWSRRLKPACSSRVG